MSYEDGLISIHAFRVEGDAYNVDPLVRSFIFQSTPSVWKATHQLYINMTMHANFNPRLPCGRRHFSHLTYGDILRFQSTPSVWKATVITPKIKAQNRIYFNPRLPCGRRHLEHCVVNMNYGFQSTPSVWKATCLCNLDDMLQNDFNPRLPCGRRLQKLTGDLLNTHIICIYVHKAVELFYNR